MKSGSAKIIKKCRSYKIDLNTRFKYIYKIMSCSKLEEHPYNLVWFSRNRNEQYVFANKIIKDINNGYTQIIIKASVKSGKKDIVEICSLFTSQQGGLKIKTYFISAFHRVENEEQREELQKYNVYVHSIINKKSVLELNNQIEEDLKIYDEIYIHLDELDFGSGKDQLLSKFYKIIASMNKVKIFLYSATPEEADPEYLSITTSKVIIRRFIPSPLYYGIKEYINDHRFYQASPFFEYINKNEFSITEQGNELLTTLFRYTKEGKGVNSAVLRLTGSIPGSTKKKRTSWFEYIKGFSKPFEEYCEKEYKTDIKITFIGYKDQNWSPNYKDWKNTRQDMAQLYIICECAKRSTLWVNHPFLVWYHTYRADGCYSTVVQDQERLVLYKTAYNRHNFNFEDIKCVTYGDMEIAKVSAGIITWDVYNGKKLTKNLYKSNKNKQFSIEAKIELKANNWDDIPERYRERKTEEATLKRFPKLTKIIHWRTKKKSSWVIPDELWNRLKKWEGFRMATCRSSITKFLRKVCDEKKYAKPPIYDYEFWVKEVKEGINAVSQCRVNIYYEDDNPENYKYIVRKFVSARPNEKKITNKSMYNSIVKK